MPFANLTLSAPGWMLPVMLGLVKGALEDLSAAFDAL